MVKPLNSVLVMNINAKKSHSEAKHLVAGSGKLTICLLYDQGPGVMRYACTYTNSRELLVLGDKHTNQHQPSESQYQEISRSRPSLLLIKSSAFFFPFSAMSWGVQKKSLI